MGGADDSRASIYWNQASLLAQVGLLHPAKQADKLRDPTLPSNELIDGARPRRAGRRNRSAL
jgi:hypothetical protein